MCRYKHLKKYSLLDIPSPIEYVMLNHKLCTVEPPKRGQISHVHSIQEKDKKTGMFQVCPLFGGSNVLLILERKDVRPLQLGCD